MKAKLQQKYVKYDIVIQRNEADTPQTLGPLPVNRALLPL